jgi:hypothetical protein
MVVSQPLVAHGLGGQDVDDLQFRVGRMTNQALWFFTNPKRHKSLGVGQACLIALLCRLSGLSGFYGLFGFFGYKAKGVIQEKR